MNYAYVSVLTVNIIAFVAGTVLTWSSPVLSKLENKATTPFDRPITSEEGSWISSIFALGAIFGPFLFGYLADKIGRKKTLLISSVPFIVCYYMLAFGKSIAIFYVARFFLGAALGGVYTVIPMYVGEVADDRSRGTLSSMMNVYLCFGIFFSYCLGPYVSLLVFNVILGSFPILFFVLFSLLAPESPQYFLKKNKPDEARTALQKIRGPGADIKEEMIIIKKKIDEDGNGTVVDIFRSKGLVKSLLITVGLAVLQQFSGVNVIFFYAQQIFEAAGSSLEPTVCSIIVGCVQFSTSFLTPILVDRWGRKVLLLISAVGMALSEIPLGIYYYLKDTHHDVSNISFLPVLCLVCYILMYNFGYGPLPWVVMGEIFPPSVKSSASSITAGVCWLAGFLTGRYFNLLSNAIGIGQTFWIFSGFCVAAVPFGIFVVVETKGKSFIEIQKALSS